MKLTLLNDWNDELIKYIFFDKDNLSIPVRRISASVNLLALVSNVDLTESERARIIFLSSFKENVKPISSSSTTLLADKFPRYFAHLYLSLLAGASDRETVNQGDFRLRLSSIVGDESSGKSLLVESLPKLWKNLEQWCALRRAKYGDCRLLQLPNKSEYGRETIIGISKRIAFPAYSDEKLMGACLAEIETARVSKTYFIAVSTAIEKKRKKFSNAFKEEFHLFENYCSNGELNKAFNTYFWGAVKAHDQIIETADIKKHGIFHLGLSISDPYNPQLMLFTDSVGVKSLEKYCDSDLYSANPERYASWLRGDDEWSIGSILKLSDNISGLGRSKAIRQLRTSGTLIFLPNELGHMTTDGFSFDECDLLILLPIDEARQITDLFKLRIYEFNDIRKQYGIIKIQMPIDCELSDFLANLNQDVRSIFVKKNNFNKPRIDSNSWVGSKLLINPVATISFSNLLNVRHINCKYLDAEGVTKHSFYVDPINPNISLEYKKLNGDVRKLVVSYIDATDRLLTESSFYVLNQIPPLHYRHLRDSNKWMVDGPRGRLMPYTYETKYLDAPKVLSDASKTQNLLYDLKKAFVISRDDDSSLSLDSHTSVDAFPEILGWIADHLLALFHSRQSISFDELSNELTQAADLLNVSIRSLIRCLLSATWLCKVSPSNYRAASFVLGPRCISIKNRTNDYEVKISGMFSIAELKILENTLAKNDFLLFNKIKDESLSIGVISLVVNDRDTIDNIISLLGLTPLELSATLLPFSDFTEFEFESSSKPLVVSDYEYFDNYKWAPANEMKTTAMDRSAMLRLMSPYSKELFVGTGTGYLKTDSFFWAQVLCLTLANVSVATISKFGECLINSKIFEIPQALALWWAHHGGGVFCLRHDQRIVLGGKADLGLWKGVAFDDFPPDSSSSFYTKAIERRDFIRSFIKKNK